MNWIYFSVRFVLQNTLLLTINCHTNNHSTVGTGVGTGVEQGSVLSIEQYRTGSVLSIVNIHAPLSRPLSGTIDEQTSACQRRRRNYDGQMRNPFLFVLASSSLLLAHGADSKSDWRPLPLVSGGKVDRSWVHIGYGKFIVDDGALRTEPAPQGLGLLVFKKEKFGN